MITAAKEEALPPPANPVELAQLAAKLDLVIESQEEIRTALVGSLSPGSPPGLLRRMDASELDRADLRRQLAELCLAVRALEAAPGRAALSWADRIALAVITMGLAGLGAIVGRYHGGPNP